MRVTLNITSPKSCQPLTFSGKGKNTVNTVSMKASDACVAKKMEQKYNVTCFLLACERLYAKKTKGLNSKA